MQQDIQLLLLNQMGKRGRVRVAQKRMLTLYSLHHFVNNILKSGDLQMYLFWNKNIFFLFGVNLSRIGLVTLSRQDLRSPLVWMEKQAASVGGESLTWEGTACPSTVKLQGEKNIAVLE